MQRKGGDLASINSLEENSGKYFRCFKVDVTSLSPAAVHAVLTADSNDNNGWVGGTDSDVYHDSASEGAWAWSDGSTFPSAWDR